MNRPIWFDWVIFFCDELEQIYCYSDKYILADITSSLNNTTNNSYNIGNI